MGPTWCTWTFGKIFSSNFYGEWICTEAKIDGSRIEEEKNGNLKGDISKIEVHKLFTLIYVFLKALDNNQNEIEMS